jgi:hypothetical protein
MSRTRKNAAANEALDIAKIVSGLASQSPIGIKINEAFKNMTGVNIESARKRPGSSRGTHYDLEIKVNGVWKKVEHKGSQKYKVPKLNEPPWKRGVQFYNGGCEKFKFPFKYLRLWYDMYYASGVLKRQFGIESETPTFEEWYIKDCKAQSDPRTPFGKELKEKVRSERGPLGSLLQERSKVIAALDITDEDKDTLKREVLAIANSVLDEKDYWLSIYGNLDDEFHVVWHPKFKIDNILDVNVNTETDRDLKFQFICSNDFKFNGIMRWGKGAGFSCFRIDLK